MLAIRTESRLALSTSAYRRRHRTGDHLENREHASGQGSMDSFIQPVQAHRTKVGRTSAKTSMLACAGPAGINEPTQLFSADVAFMPPCAGPDSLGRAGAFSGVSCRVVGTSRYRARPAAHLSGSINPGGTSKLGTTHWTLEVMCKAGSWPGLLVPRAALCRTSRRPPNVGCGEYSWLLGSTNLHRSAWAKLW
jgi:hypothetical protein